MTDAASNGHDTTGGLAPPVTRPRDPTGASRSKRYRDSRKGTVTARSAQPNKREAEKSSNSKGRITVARDAAPVPNRDGEKSSKSNVVKPFIQPRWQVANVVTYGAAIGLATVSAGFSITGLTAVFTGAFWPVIAMGVALETGKLAAVAWLGLRRGSRALRAALIALVTVLMGLNAVGCYGFLAKAHIASAVASETAVAGRAADVAARMTVQTGVVSDLERRLGQIDGAVEKATSRGRTGSAMALAADQRRIRTELAAERVAAGKALADLQVEKTKIEGERRTIEADLGPVRYLATLMGADNETVLRWFILTVALLLDPAAVLLLLAAVAGRRQ